MSARSQHNNIILAIAGFIAVVFIVGFIGFIALDRDPEVLQGQLEVSEYRISSKVPGRILELRVQEGDFVHAGDTVAILDAPEVHAKMTQAQSAEEAASALDQMARAGARQEQVQGAYQLLQQATAAADVMEKSYQRVERLFQEGVVSEQKRDETKAQRDAAVAQQRAAQSQYDMAVNGARREEKMAAAAQVSRAKGAVQEVNAYIGETVQVAQMDGEVTEIFPKVGELVGTGAPIMNIAMMDQMWGTFSIREDQLEGMKIGDELKAHVPAFDKDMRLKVYHIKDMGSYAVWKATKANGQYDMKTFEVKAKPIDPFDGLRPGMTLVMKR